MNMICDEALDQELYLTRDTADAHGISGVTKIFFAEENS